MVKIFDESSVTLIQVLCYSKQVRPLLTQSFIIHHSEISLPFGALNTLSETES